MLNPESPLPLYHQLAEILMDQIRTGKYTPGDVMPSETGMAKQYGIGRPTVRQAMDVLVRKGLVERKRGSGTFVTEQDQQVDLFSLAGTSQAFLTQGIKTSSITIEKASLKNIAVDKTNPFDGGAAYFLSRLTLVKNSPVLLEKFYLHPEMFTGLENLDLENRSLSRIVSDHYYLKPDSGRQSFKISLLNSQEADLLKLEPQSPILEVERTLNFPKAEAAIFSRLFCRTDMFAFSQTMNLKNNIYTQEKSI